MTAAESRHRIRVRYCETDRMGVAHHASYLAWFEEARTEWMRQRGLTYRELEERGVFLPVVHANVDYKRSVTYDDEVEIVTTVAGRTRASMSLDYRVTLVGDGEVVARGTTKHACVDAAGKVRGLPEDL